MVVVLRRDDGFFGRFDLLGGVVVTSQNRPLMTRVVVSTAVSWNSSARDF
jgi:hypothetical protein